LPSGVLGPPMPLRSLGCGGSPDSREFASFWMAGWAVCSGVAGVQCSLFMRVCLRLKSTPRQANCCFCSCGFLLYVIETEEREKISLALERVLRGRGFCTTGDEDGQGRVGILGLPPGVGAGCRLGLSARAAKWPGTRRPRSFGRFLQDSRTTTARRVREVASGAVRSSDRVQLFAIHTAAPRPGWNSSADLRGPNCGVYANCG